MPDQITAADDAAHELFAIDLRLSALVELDALDTDEGVSLMRRSAEIRTEYAAA